MSNPPVSISLSSYGADIVRQRLVTHLALTGAVSSVLASWFLLAHRNTDTAPPVAVGLGVENQLSSMKAAKARQILKAGAQMHMIEAGWLSALPYLAAVIGMLLVSWGSDKLQKR